ncbi:alcohol dehydrogenase catalytic domain-containing protein [Streptomyces sp. NPDC046881]|uniref:alcohol dehydrogenase catalytic domain-containing protein n=1 Tax=Streptomyces sp. NPDC046881 TaxID=3155374 RepID=UPI0033E1CC33
MFNAQHFSSLPALEVRLRHRRIPRGRRIEIVRNMVPLPGPGECVVRPSASTVCGSDMNTVIGHKHIGEPASVRLGHEMVGVIAKVGPGVTRLHAGDFVVLKPHAYAAEHASCARAGQIFTYQCQGRGCTQHAGFSWDGAFCSEGTFPAAQLEVVHQELIAITEASDTLPRAAAFSLVEPVACCRSATFEIEKAFAAVAGNPRDAFTQDVLILGTGPIGVITAQVLLDHGCTSVVLKDVLAHRASMAEWVLSDPRVRRFDPALDEEHRFRLVMASANCPTTIPEAEVRVAPRGMIYLLSGLNAAGREIRDYSGAWHYEDLHRNGAWAYSESEHHPRIVGGHSGYAETIFEDSARWVTEANHLPILDRLITHYIPGIESPQMISRFPHITPSWTTPDRSPALGAILHRAVPTEHLGMKVALLPQRDAVSA